MLICNNIPDEPSPHSQLEPRTPTNATEHLKRNSNEITSPQGLQTH